MKKHKTIKIIKSAISNFVIIISISIVLIIILLFNFDTKNYDGIINTVLSEFTSKIGTILIISISFISILMAIFKYKKDIYLDKLNQASIIFDNSKEGIIITDENMKITYVNSTYVKISGYSKEDTIGKNFFEYKRENSNYELEYKKLYDYVNKHGEWSGELWDNKKNGEAYPKYTILKKIINKEGEIQYIGIYEDLTYSKNINKTIEEFHNYDNITGIPNETFFKEILSKKLEKEDDKYALISFRIINYIEIREKYTSNTIDKFIIRVVDIIKDCLNDSDVIGRILQNEFYILKKINYENEENEKDIFTNIINKIKNTIDIDGNEIFFSVNCGISIYPNDSDDYLKLIENANIARYYSTKKGINNYLYYEKSLREKYHNKMQIEYLLRKGIENNEFVLYYQPQVDLKSGNIIGMESLIRWQNSELGFVSPNEFIPLAEKTELIIPIGNWVLEEAIRQNKIWHDKGYNHLIIAVNVSPVQFDKTDIVLICKNLLEKYNMEGRYLEIEITENLLVNNIDDIKLKFIGLKALGIKIAIDDFGTGYSSLKYLSQLEIDKLKIDRSFIKDYPAKDTGTIARTVIDLSKNLNLNVIAEGAETLEQIDFLKKMNCDEIQGYFYSPPVDKEKFELLLKK